MDRAAARFRNLTHRGTSFGFITIGPTFKAAIPEELEARFNEWLIEVTRRQRPS